MQTVTPNRDVYMGQGIYLQKKFCYEISASAKKKKNMFAHFQIGKGWGQFTNIIVLNIALFYALYLNPSNPLWWCEELENMSFMQYGTHHAISI